ncbi:MAG: PilZ domain-containing protein [Myxococcota bacterium]
MGFIMAYPSSAALAIPTTIPRPFNQPTWLVLERPGYPEVSGFLESHSDRRCTALFAHRWPPLLPVGSSVDFRLTCLALELTKQKVDSVEGHVVARIDLDGGVVYAFSVAPTPCGLTGIFPRHLNGVERRGARRVPMTLVAELIGAGGRRFACEITDLSATGAALQVDIDDEKILANTQSFELRFANMSRRHKSSPGHPAVLSVPLQVIHRRLLADGVRYGASFLLDAMKEQEQRHLRRFVLEHQRYALGR